MNLGCPPFLKLGLSVLLCCVVFLAFCSYLLFTIMNGRILSADFYAGRCPSSARTKASMTSLVVDPALPGSVAELFGSVEAPPEDVALVAKKIMPPAYLQAAARASARPPPDLGASLKATTRHFSSWKPGCYGGCIPCMPIFLSADIIINTHPTPDTNAARRCRWRA